MKKHIGYIDLDSLTADWLLEHLPGSLLKKGIRQLVEGEYSSLMLELEEEDRPHPRRNVITCKELTIDENARSVKRSGEEIFLTPKEFDILLFLAKNRGQVFTKEQIYRDVWENEYVMDDSNIMAFIRKIRKKIEPNPDAPEYILTIWGIGYKFNDAI